jgi:hypothetical protein
VCHGLFRLITEWATRCMWKALTRQPLTRPTPIKTGQQDEEFYPRRRPGSSV